MSTKPYKGFEPKWVLDRAPENSYRSIFRWGAPDFFKYPKESLYNYVKTRCNLKDDDFRQYNDDIGMEPVALGPAHAPQIDDAHVAAIAAIVGEQNVSQSDYDRLAVAYGQTMYDLLRMRHRRFDSLPDLVVFPETSEQIERIVAYVTEQKLPLYVYGGGSSVTRGVEPVKGGVSLDMRRNFNKVIRFNEVDQTITVQAGM
ncbi:MAG: FAD-binding oxidoreductase, partial [Clostridia bacterium]|nr:FAD-binding oxidoreductase [Clostridia bacterium]